ncbi:hypothetical protein [Halobacillus litoralis]|uniref:hypothetical protein n=1 Tax=Halobacillus litoralis TaxID=45668 RepID=UPI002493A65C|nr:hypothetical protein [Halobacillus litoralis]
MGWIKWSVGNSRRRPPGTARAEEYAGKPSLLSEGAEAVPAASIHRQAIREKQQQTLTTPLD